MGICREHCQTSNKEALMKNRKNYVMTKSNLTLTQSGLLAVLLQRQRHKKSSWPSVAQTGSRCGLAFGVVSLGVGAHSRHDRSSTIPPSPLLEPFRAILEPFTKANCHVLPNPYLQRAPATDSRRSADTTPEWVGPNGKSPKCDSYEARLLEQLDTFAQRRIQRAYHYSFIAPSSRD